jgi:hypothetical protein
MTDKWSELLGGGGLRGGVTPAAAAPAAAATEGSAFSGWAMLLPIAIVAVIAVVVAGSGGSKTVKSPAKTVDEHLNVIQAVAEPDHGAKHALVDSAQGAVVGPRNAQRPLFAQDDSELSGLQKPFAGAEAGFSYKDFQRAMANGREMPEVDRAISSNSSQTYAHISGMKAFLKRNGMSVDEFAEARGMPDTVLESWDTPHESIGVQARQPTDDSEETLMLARDALQYVPTNVSDVAIAPVLREILAARTEAATAGVQLPGIADEQLEALKFWSSRDGTAGGLAKSILSRA